MSLYRSRGGLSLSSHPALRVRRSPRIEDDDARARARRCRSGQSRRGRRDGGDDGGPRPALRHPPRGAPVHGVRGSSRARREEGDASGAKIVAAARRLDERVGAERRRASADAMTGYVDAAARLPAQWETIRAECRALRGARRHRRPRGARHGAREGSHPRRRRLPWTPDAQRRISQTLRAVALAGHDDRARLLGGRLEADIDAPSDFGRSRRAWTATRTIINEGAARPAAEERAARGEDGDRGAQARRAGGRSAARERAAQRKRRRAREARAKAKAKATELGPSRAGTRGAGRRSAVMR